MFFGYSTEFFFKKFFKRETPEIKIFQTKEQTMKIGLEGKRVRVEGGGGRREETLTDVCRRKPLVKKRKRKKMERK